MDRSVFGWMAVAAAVVSFSAEAITAKKVDVDLAKLPVEDAIWKSAAEETITLMAQPMIAPRPKKTTTEKLKVQAVQNGSWIAFRLRWTDKEKSEAGKLGEFSDAVAMQFPAKNGPNPPAVFMGDKENPVHIFHWRAQYQRDEEKGKPSMKDLYPNMNPDMYPMEFADPGKLGKIADDKREVFSHGMAAGNPQSYTKHAVDEIFAEGFGSSSVIENVEAKAKGTWKSGEWTVIFARPLKRENGSVLESGKNSFVAFAVWQGGHQEVGARKSVTMSWVPLTF